MPVLAWSARSGWKSNQAGGLGKESANLDMTNPEVSESGPKVQEEFAWQYGMLKFSYQDGMRGREEVGSVLWRVEHIAL